MKTVTIFTPTYNRAYVIENLYKSLQRQTCYDFEWLIVDDGSTDDTESVVAEWSKENPPFPIYYYKKENGGKHRAINYALKKAQGEFFFIVDSDDVLCNTAIENTIDFFSTLPSELSQKYAGVVGCKGYYNGNLVGTSFEGDYLDCLSVEREKYGISGDKAEIFFTSVLREYPFPEFENEKFVTEAVVWDKISIDGYYLRYFNKTIYLCEYLADGLTQKGLELYYENPRGYGHYLRQSRKLEKFSKAVQRYFDVECYLHWRTRMNIKEVAGLIGAKPCVLMCQVIVYQIRKQGHRCKRLIREVLKRGYRHEHS